MSFSTDTLISIWCSSGRKDFDNVPVLLELFPFAGSISVYIQLITDHCCVLVSMNPFPACVFCLHIYLIITLVAYIAYTIDPDQSGPLGAV